MQVILSNLRSQVYFSIKNKLLLLLEKASSSTSTVKLCFFICILLVLLLQAKISGFPDGFEGSVSGHHLSTMMNTTPQNYFTGYALKYWKKEGQPYYWYASRVPPWPGMLFGKIVSLLPYSQGSKLHFSHQLMNLIFFTVYVFCLCYTLSLGYE